MPKPAGDEVAKLDPYKFMAVMAIMRRVALRPGNVREMAWLMPRMARAGPYLGYLVVAATKP